MPIRRSSAALALLLILTGCTSVLHDATPKAQPPAAPISEGQVGDLLSDEARAPHEDESDPFLKVKPDRCAGVVQEVRAPFLFDDPPAVDSGGDWDDLKGSVSIEELVAVYPADFQAQAAVERAKRTLQDCQSDTMPTTTSDGIRLDFHLDPYRDSGSPDIALWSMRSEGDWNCFNTFVAAHNAAVEITSCGSVDDYDARPLADAALERIRKLANTTA